MGTVLTIIVVAALVFGIMAFIGSGGKVDEAAAGAAGGAMIAGGCLFQLFIIGIMALAGLWLLGLVFG